MLIKKRFHSKTKFVAPTQDPLHSAHKPSADVLMGDTFAANGKLLEELSEKESNLRSRIEALQQQADELEIELQEKINQAQAQADALVLEAESAKSDVLVDLETKQAEIAKRDEESKLNYSNEKKRGFAEGYAEAESHIEELVEILNTFANSKKQLLKEVEHDIGSLAVDIAAKIIGDEIALDKTVLEQQINSAITKVVKGKGNVQVFINPADEHYCPELKAHFSEILDPAINLIFRSDSTVDPSSCVIETKGGRFDAKFSTQIDAIKVALEKYLGHKIFDLDAQYPDEDSDLDFRDEIKVPEMSADPTKLNNGFDGPSADELSALEEEMGDLFAELGDEDLAEAFGDDDLAAMIDLDAGTLETEDTEKKPELNEDEDLIIDFSEEDFLDDDDELDDDEIEFDSIGGDAEGDFEEFNEADGESDEILDDRFPEY